MSYGIFILLFLTSHFVTCGRLTRIIGERMALHSSLVAAQAECATLNKMLESMAIVLKNSQVTIESQNVVLARLSADLAYKDSVINHMAIQFDSAPNTKKDIH